jgi:hypothetical protein
MSQDMISYKYQNVTENLEIIAIFVTHPRIRGTLLLEPCDGSSFPIKACFMP